MNYHSVSLWSQKKTRPTRKHLSSKTFSPTQGFWYTFMKIKFFLLLLSAFSLMAFAEDCSYLKVPDQSLVRMDYEWSYNNTYPYELCELNSPIHEEAVEYIQGIRDIKGKSVREVVTDVGNTFCRGYFWLGCGTTTNKSFYWRFVTSCEEARNKTWETLRGKWKIETISTDFIAYSYNNCDELAETYVMAYKETAMEEVARYHGKMIEESSEAYLKPSHEKMQTLGTIWDSFLKIFGNIARSVEWWTQTVYQ